jgi:proteasome lid subunit RPN8/RPN11
MIELMKESSPNETGGYLYGGVDPPLRRVTVVAACAAPPGTDAGPMHLDLPPAGRSEEERQLRWTSGRRLVPVGSWHSHPQGGTGLSSADQRTADRFVRENADLGLPTLLVVVTPGGVGAHLLE